MISLNLGIGILTRDSRFSADAVSDLLRDVPRIFRDASDQDIDLTMQVSSRPFGAAFAGPLHSAYLHAALEKLTGRQRSQRKVRNIGLLIADAYKDGPDYFGLMFDEAFKPGGTDAGALTPREGCAVFVDAIRTARGTADEQLQELLFTAVHELGHVFNLQHVTEPSFMARSALRSTPFPPSAFAFTVAHCAQLAQCSSSRHVWPGGSAFEDLGLLATANTGRATPAAPFGLELAIDMAQREFWPFEPVELDLAMRCVGPPGSSFNVPDMLDPGHQCFTIWIEEPDGARRKYRSPRHYCPPLASRTISADKPLVRDISIFGQSGGYTFRRAGVHRLQAMFDLPQQGRLTSNVIEVNVLPVAPGDARYDAFEGCLADRGNARLLYHRQEVPGVRARLSLLREFCAHYPDQPAAGMARYAMGRAVAAAVASDRTKTPSRRRLRRALDELAAARDSPGLTDHRRELAFRAAMTIDAVMNGGP